jgi:hypothetical protein
MRHNHAAPIPFGNTRPLDDPHNIDQSLFVCFHWNEIRWPHGARELRYLTGKRTHTIHGWALYTMFYSEAETFATREAATAWLEAQEAKRNFPYGVTIATVAELRALVGYPEEGISRR